MSYIQNYQDHSVPFTERELDDYLKRNSSVVKTNTRPDGKKDYILSTKAMLNSNGKPIPVEEFLILTGQRVLITPVKREKISLEERAVIDTAKSQWKKDNHNHKMTPAFKSLRQLKIALETSAMVN